MVSVGLYLLEQHNLLMVRVDILGITFPTQVIVCTDLAFEPMAFQRLHFTFVTFDSGKDRSIGMVIMET